MKDPKKIHSKQIREGLFEVEGILISADSMTEAIKKWRSESETFTPRAFPTGSPEQNKETS